MKISLSKVAMDISSQDDLQYALQIIRGMQDDAKPKDIETKVELTADELQAVAAPLVEDDEDSIVYDDQIPGLPEPFDKSKVEEKPVKKPAKPRKSRQSPSAKAGHSVMGGGIFNDSKKLAKPSPADAKSAFAADPLDDPVEKVEQPVDDIPFEVEKKSAQPTTESAPDDDIDLNVTAEVKSESAKVLQMPVKLDKKVFLKKVRDAITHCSSDEVGEILEGVSGHRSTRDIHEDFYGEIIAELDALLGRKVAG